MTEIWSLWHLGRIKERKVLGEKDDKLIIMRMIIPFSSSFVNFTRRWKSRPGILSSWDLLRNEMRIQTDIEIHLSVPGVNKMPCDLQCLVSVQPLTFSSGRPPLLLINLSLLFTIMIINELKCHSFIRQLDQSHRYLQFMFSYLSVSDWWKKQSSEPTPLLLKRRWNTFRLSSSNAERNWRR